MNWTTQRDNILRRNYPCGDLSALADRLGVTVTAVKSRAQVLGLHRKINSHRPWTERQMDYLRQHYADECAEDIARKVGHSVRSIWQKAKQMGLAKSHEFFARCGRQVANTEGARRNRFTAGMTPANKGRRQADFMSAEGIAASSRTRFKPGNRPHNQREVGTERTHADGYVYLRTEEGCVLKHRHVWEQVHGPVPDGYVIVFIDGNRQNCSLDNLQLISRADLGRRRAARETPEQRRQRTAKSLATRLQAIRRDRLRIHWGLEPLGNLVKRW
jgi:hypothetical protein